jgi:hypothetical protein
MAWKTRRSVLAAAMCVAAIASSAIAQGHGEGDLLVATLPQATTATGTQVLSVDVADFGAIPNDNKDDSVAIQAALDARAPITTINTPGVYIIGANRQLVSFGVGFHVATLTVPSGETLKCAPGVTIKLNYFANCLMIANKGGSGGDTNITLDGGTWDANGGWNDMRAPSVPVKVFGGEGGYRPYWCGSAMQLGMCRNLTVKNLTVLNGKKYAIYVAGGTKIRVDNITFNTGSDGVHLNGPASDIKISNIRGFCHDNMIAIVASEGAYYPEITGDAITTARNIVDLEISDITCGLPGKPTFQPIRFTGRATDTISKVRISRVSGDGSLAGHGIAFSDDNSDCDPGPDVYPAGLEHTIMRNIVIEDVSLKCQPGYAVVQIGGSGVKDITVRRISQESPNDSIVLVNNNAALERLTIEDITAPDNNARLFNIEAAVDELNIRNAVVQSTDISRVVQVAPGARVNRMLVEDCGFIGGAQQIMQWFNSAPLDLTLRRTTMVTNQTAIQAQEPMRIRSEQNVWQAKTALTVIGAGRIDLEGGGDICPLPVGIDSRGKGVRINNPDIKTDVFKLLPRSGDRVFNVNPKRHEVPAGTGVLTCIKGGSGPGTAKWDTNTPSLKHVISAKKAQASGTRVLAPD